MDHPTSKELRHGANQRTPNTAQGCYIIELFESIGCGSEVRFFSYNSPLKLIETIFGRGGD
jgi:hypothetical protein